MHNIIYSSFLCILKMNTIHKWPLSTQCKQELWKKNPASFDVNAEGGGMQTTPDAGPSLVEEDHAQRKFPSLPIWRVSAFNRQLFLDISTNIIPINAGVGGLHRRCKKKKLWTTFSDAQGSATHGCYRSDPCCPDLSRRLIFRLRTGHNWSMKDHIFTDTGTGWSTRTPSYQQHLLQVWLLHKLR